MNKTAIYTVIFLVGFVLVSLWSFWLAVRPPKLKLDYNPKNFGLKAEEITITTYDGLRLSGWFIPGNKERALIFLHGYPAEKSDMLSLASHFWPEFSLLLFDLRYFGQSEGTHTTLGIKERRDVISAVDFLKARDFEKIGIFGFSLGGAISLTAAHNDPRINAVATYASFADLRALGHEAYRTLGPLKYPLVFLMEIWASLLFGEFPNTLSPEKASKTLDIPVFVIHSLKDEQILFKHSQRLKDALADNPYAQFYFPESGRHGEIDFTQKLQEFFKTALNNSR